MRKLTTVLFAERRTINTHTRHHRAWNGLAKKKKGHQPRNQPHTCAVSPRRHAHATKPTFRQKRSKRIPLKARARTHTHTHSATHSSGISETETSEGRPANRRSLVTKSRFAIAACSSWPISSSSIKRQHKTRKLEWERKAVTWNSTSAEEGNKRAQARRRPRSRPSNPFQQPFGLYLRLTTGLPRSAAAAGLPDR